jgi:Smg protein
MNENVLDVLVYLFENFIYDEPEGPSDRDSMQADLVRAGFAPAGIAKAFAWMDALDERRNAGAAPTERDAPVRVYAEPELERLDLECRGFLLFLEQQGVLDPARRELVLDRLMALEMEAIDLTDLKWVVLMVLFNQPGQEAAFAWMESHLLESGGERVH